MSAEDHALLTGAVDTFTALTRELQLKGVTLERLRWLMLRAAATRAVLQPDEAYLGIPGRDRMACPPP